MKFQIELSSLLTLSPNIFVIAIPGGPCAGKTSGMSYLKEKLSARGHKVFIVGEAASDNFASGIKFGRNELPHAQFEEKILLGIIFKEELVLAAAKEYALAYPDKKVIVLCDRGLIDNEAYALDHFEKIVSDFSKRYLDTALTYADISIRRYHAVIHMRTAALGAEEFYTLATNTHRKESLEKARELDQLTLDAWVRHHPHVRVVTNNHRSFKGKLRRLLAEICGIIGDPKPIEDEVKYLIRPVDWSLLPHYHLSYIAQDYLLSGNPKEVSRIRRREDQYGEVCHYHTIKEKIRPGLNIETDRMVRPREYELLSGKRNRRMKTVVKHRYSFVWEEYFLEMDRFLAPHNRLVRDNTPIIECERLKSSEVPKLPPWADVIREVTDDDDYSNRSIASGSLAC